MTPRPLDDSIYLKHRDEIINQQAEQIEMLTKQVDKLMGGIDKVEDQVNTMQTQVLTRDDMYAKKKVSVHQFPAVSGSCCGMAALVPSALFLTADVSRAPTQFTFVVVPAG